jgi:DNA primase
MGLFPQQFLDDLRQQASIVQVVQDYVPLKRAGNSHKGLCPFHSEKTPSFTVHEDKGYFYCFGCHATGNVFKFLELHEKVGFPDAVRMVAQKFGVSLPETEESSEEARRDASLRESLLKAHETAAAFFREQLAAPAGARARRQLADRGIEPRTIDALGLGYGPSGTGLRARLASQGFSESILLQSGLVIKRDNGDLADRFRNRLMIPIGREGGSIVAFGGRAMDDDQVPKYLNSSETAIYSKGRTLYGLNLTKSFIQQAGFAVLVEGYFDFAQLFQAQNGSPVVASCGTALTPAQAQLLRRFASKVVLSYDPDAAGQGAAVRSCELLVAEGFDVNVAVMDSGLDPDTYIRRNGADAYRNKLRNSKPYLEYLLDRAAAEVDLREDESRRQFLGKMLAVASRIPDPAARDQFGDRLAHKARITEEVVRAEIRKAAVARRSVLTERELPSFGQIKDAERGLIWALIHNAPDALRALSKLDEEDLNELTAREVFYVARQFQNQVEEFSPSTLLERLNTVNAQLVTRIAAPPESPAPPLACIQAIKRLRWTRERAAIQREIDRLQEQGAGQHGHEIDALWQRKKDILHRIEELN